MRTASQTTAGLHAEQQYEAGSVPLPPAGSSNELTLQDMLASITTENGTPSDPMRSSLLFECGICGDKFGDQTALFGHIEDCSPISCKLCPAILCDYERLKVHVFQCHGSHTHLCRRCLQISYGFNTQTQAAKPKHCPAQQRFVCERCPNTSDSLYGIFRHSLVHKKVQWSECNFCSFRSHITERFLSHHKGHFDKLVFFRCPYCAWGSESIYRMNAHMDQYHHGEVGFLTSSKYALSRCTFQNVLVVAFSP